MANTNAPAGLQLVQRDGAADFRASLTMFYVKANTTNAMYVGDPVIKLSAGADVNGVDGVNLATAGSTNKITGVICAFAGVGTAQLGITNPSLFALSGTPGPAYKPANATSAYYVMVCTDPQAVYSIQSNDSGGAPASTIVGKNANLASGAGSQYTGWSGWELAANSVGTSVNAQLQIVGALQEPDNILGSANADFLVRINQSTETPPATGI